MKLPLQSEKRSSINEGLYLFGKENPFLSHRSCGGKTENGTLLSIFKLLKKVDKGGQNKHPRGNH